MGANTIFKVGTGFGSRLAISDSQAQLYTYRKSQNHSLFYLEDPAEQKHSFGQTDTQYELVRVASSGILVGVPTSRLRVKRSSEPISGRKFPRS